MWINETTLTPPSQSTSRKRFMFALCSESRWMAKVRVLVCTWQVIQLCGRRHRHHHLPMRSHRWRPLSRQGFHFRTWICDSLLRSRRVRLHYAFWGDLLNVNWQSNTLDPSTTTYQILMTTLQYFQLNQLCNQRTCKWSIVDLISRAILKTQLCKFVHQSFMFQHQSIEYHLDKNFKMLYKINNNSQL